MNIIHDNSHLAPEHQTTAQYPHCFFDNNQIAEIVARQCHQRGVRIHDDECHLLADGFYFLFRLDTPSTFSDAIEIFIKDQRITLSMSMPLQNFYRYHHHQVYRLKGLIRDRLQISRCSVSLSLNRALLITSLPRHEDSMLLSYTNLALDDRDQFITTETHIRNEMCAELFLSAADLPRSSHSHI